MTPPKPYQTEQHLIDESVERDINFAIEQKHLDDELLTDPPENPGWDN